MKRNWRPPSARAIPGALACLRGNRAKVHPFDLFESADAARDADPRMAAVL